VRWRARASSEVLAPPALGGGLVLVRSIDNRVFAFGAEDGNPSPEQTAQIEEALKANGKTYEFHTFADAGHATIAYTVSQASQTKSLVPQEFGPRPVCTWGAQPDLTLATNFQDLWWNPGESGWGLGLTHQGDVVFVTWATYDLTGKAWWLSMAANRMPGVRAGLCHDTYSAHQGVEHDDMNVLVLGGRVVGIELARELIHAFLNARFSGEARHLQRLAKMTALENPLRALAVFGQSVWLDYIRRSLITGGELRRLIDEDGLRGVTSNPAIFEKAIAGGSDYKDVLEAAGNDPDIHVLLLPPDSHKTVNALQRLATIILQKSTREGFGLTVTEGMWKGKPVIGGDVGGIRLQVVNHHTGFLVNTPEGAAHRIRHARTPRPAGLCRIFISRL